MWGAVGGTEDDEHKDWAVSTTVSDWAASFLVSLLCLSPNITLNLFHTAFGNTAPLLEIWGNMAQNIEHPFS